MVRGTFIQEIYNLDAPPLPQPFEWMRGSAILIIGFSMTLSLLWCIMRPSVRPIKIVPALVMLFFVQIFAALKEYQVAGAGFEFILILLATIVNFSLLGHLLLVRSHAMHLFFVVVQVAIVFFLISSAYIWRVAPDIAYWRGRFNGLAVHPVYTGVFCAIGVMASFYFITTRVKLRWKLFNVLIGISCLVVLGLSGTRSGILMLTSFFIVDSFARPRKALIYLACVAVAVLLFVAVAPLVIEDKFQDDVRVVSAENTRIEVWEIMADQIIENPFWGPMVSASYSESSYLLAGVRIGVGGVFLTLAIALSLIIDTFRLRLGMQRTREGVSVHASWVFAAAAAAFLALSIVEGYWVQTACFHTFLFVFICGVVNYEANRLRYPR